MLSTIKFFDIMVCVKDDTGEKAEDFWPTLVEFLFATKSWWNAVCAEFDLTPAQGQALKMLDPARPLPMSTLAEALLCDASNVTGIVDKLESIVSGCLEAELLRVRTHLAQQDLPAARQRQNLPGFDCGIRGRP